jgi:hypothetical protein
MKRLFLTIAFCAASVGPAAAHGGHDHHDVPSLAQCLAIQHEGRWEEAADALDLYLHANPYHGGAWLALAGACYELRDYAAAIPAYEHAVQLGEHPTLAAYNLAACRAMMGDADEAIDSLRRAFDLGFADRAFLGSDPDFTSLAHDARFRRLVDEADSSRLSRTEGWRADIDDLVAQIEGRHVEPDHAISSDSLHAAASALKRRVTELSDAAVVVELLRIVASIGDGHTSLAVPGLRFGSQTKRAAGPVASSHRLPIRLRAFADGWFVESATEDQASIVGWKVVRIGTQKVEDVFDAVSPLCSRDNAMTVLDRAPAFMVCPEVLHSLGLIDDPSRVTLLLEDPQSNRVGRDVEAIALDASPSWVSLGDSSANPAPLRRAHPERWHWFEALEGGRTVYVQFAAVLDPGDDTVAAFCERLFAYVDGKNVDRLILDLRRNDGGNNALGRPLVDGLACRERINRKGHLFALIGRRTFSAAVCLAVDLERRTNVIFAGEPTGSSPNFIGETSLSRLPWSGLSLSVSTLRWQNSDAADRRVWIPAEIPAISTAEDERENRDPALAAILSYRLPTAP